MRAFTNLLVLTASIGWLSTSHAAPIVTTASCINDEAKLCATGITNLVVGEDLLDVSFSQLSYDDLFAVTAPFYLGDRDGAAGAREAIFAALNAAGDPWVIGVPDRFGQTFVLTPYQLNGPNEVYATAARFIGPHWGASLDAALTRNAALSDSNPTDFFTYAAFTPGVPVPATLVLFSIGLAALGLTRKK